MAMRLQPPVEIVLEIEDLAADLGERGPGGTIEALAVHACLAEKRS